MNDKRQRAIRQLQEMTDRPYQVCKNALDHNPDKTLAQIAEQLRSIEVTVLPSRPAS